MSNLAKLEFVALDISGKNFLSWVLDAEMHLDANGLGDAIKHDNTASNQVKAKAMIFLRHHLHEGLKTEYLTIKDPLDLWKNLTERFDHQKTVILPKARYEWMHLRLQDFKCVSEYNSALFRITSQLKLCGEKVSDVELLEKTFSTFHASNVVLQQQYRERGFKKYSELISCLLVAEQNNELLMKNHEARPTGSAPFPEVNAAIHDHDFRGQGRGHNRGRGRGRGRGRFSMNNSSHQKWKNNGDNERNKGVQNDAHVEATCYNCGSKGHWSRACRTPKHLVHLYQEHIKSQEKKIETNLIEGHAEDDGYFAHFDVADFYADPDGRIDHLIGDGSVQK